MRIHTEERIGSLIAAAGIIWAAHGVTSNPDALYTLPLQQGPLELCGIGILIWLHGKWRRSVAPQ
ncbi:MAG TPA: hypothetical protein VD837_01930 [Terriglobales bacterium]|nr:hypothetical protein [Terriglobales bacterium]